MSVGEMSHRTRALDYLEEARRTYQAAMYHDDGGSRSIRREAVRLCMNAATCASKYGDHRLATWCKMCARVATPPIDRR